MTTAEKRAELEARGEPWPVCDCHSRRMRWQRRPEMRAGGRFYCPETINARLAAQRAARKQQGLCVFCGVEAATELRCSRHADEHAEYMAQPSQVWRHALANNRFSVRQSTVEGFQPTGVGQAAIAAAMTKGRKNG